MKLLPHCSGRRHAAVRVLLLGLLVWGATAQASIRVDIDGVDADLRRNIQALLSLERYKDRERIEPEAVERLYRRADDEVRSALRPFGYYEPKITTSIQPEDAQHVWHVHIQIEPGTPVIIESVSIVVQGPGSEDPVFLRLKTPEALVKGHRLEHRAYEQAKSDLQATALTFGFLDARMLRNEMRVDLANHTAQIDLAIETGERYRFGATTIEQHSIRDDRVRRYLRYQEGEPYDEGKRLRTQFALDDSQFFSTVEVLPGEKDSATHTVPMHITAISARNTWSIGPGYGTDTGARISAGFLDPRVNSLGDRLIIQIRISQIEQDFDVRYDIPFGDPAIEKTSLQALAQTEQLSSSVEVHDISIGPSLYKVVDRWQMVGTVAALRAETYDPYSIKLLNNMIVPGFSLARVPEGYLGENLLGRSLYVNVVGSSAALGADTEFLRVDTQAERVFALWPKWHLLLRGEFGDTLVKDFPELPGIYRFFAGGDQSVRGFSFDSLSPTIRTPAGVPVQIGGRALITGTVEFERDLPHNFGIATFYDMGNAINHLSDPLASAVGIGFRWRLPVVTVGLDIGQAVKAPGYPSIPGPRLNLNISPKL
jgi:translocation and assembly module TamA